MFLEAIWEDELSKSLAKETAAKVHFSASASHPILADEVDEYELPDLYEGQCSCKATCVYSEKGPWSEVENHVNFQKPDEGSSDDDDFDEGDLSEKLAGFGKLKLGSVSTLILLLLLFFIFFFFHQ